MPQFSRSSGGMAGLVEGYAWERTPLGPRAAWPERLQTLVGLMLASPQPMFMAWGPERTWLHNDAFVPILGRKHPAALGRPAMEVWAEAGHDLQPLFDKVFAGEAVHMDDFALTLDRRGRPEEAHFAFSYTPVQDETGTVAGLFGVCTETTRQVLAERRQSAATERQRRLFDQAPGFMAVLRGPEHVFEFVNQAYLRLIGQRDVVGRRIREALPELALQGFYGLLDQVYASGERFAAADVPVRLRTSPDQPFDERYLDFIYEPIVDEAGRVTGIFVEGHDVTEAHEAREKVRANARRQALLVELADRSRDLEDPGDLSFTAAELLGRALEVSRGGYGTIDPRNETISIERDWNAPGIKSIAGVLHFRDYGSYIDELKQGITVVVTDAEKDPRTAATAEALKRISAQSFVNMPVTEQGGFVALLYLNHEAPRQWTPDELALIREVAERTRMAVQRRRAEQELRDLAASLERQVAERTAERDRVWRNSRDLLVIVGADGVFRAVNPAWTVLLGHEPQEVVGHGFAEFMWPEDVPVTAASLRAAADQHDLTSFENRFRHKDGTPRWISWHTSAEGDLVYAYGRDVTAEKEQQKALQVAEEQLRQAQKMEAVGQLTGGIAHDFNNLLMSINGSLELVGTRIAQGRTADVGKYITAAQGAAQRAASLTHRLLAFSRRQTLDPKPVNVNRLVAGMEELIRRTVGPAIEVEVVGAGGLWTTFADPNQLENALLNLCINARDAMPDGGRLTIETGNRWLDNRAARERGVEPGQYISLCVSDTGTGMTPEVIARAFDPFFTTKPLGTGTGLGLSMIYGFAKQSGGQVRIYSEVGEGTMVCIYLPRFQGEGGPEQVPAELGDAPRAQDGETVLVVDDEPIIRMLVTDVLEELGYGAIEAMDGAGALRVLQSDRRVDLLVTDVGLPAGMNGRQVADAGRAIRPGLKVLFITGYAENAVIGNGHLDPGMQVLTKPFLIEELASRIKELIRRERE